MKIGVISDIHSDLRALQAALKLLDDQHVEQIVCCGDVLHAFRHMPRDNEVIDTLIYHNIPCVLGNHDEIVLADQRDLRAWENALPNLESRRLYDNAFNFLANLPERLMFNWCDKSVAITHETLDGLHPNNDDHFFKTFANSVMTDIALVGHIHAPLRAEVGNMWIFNPGSICGRHYAGSRTCAILKLPECYFQVFGLDDSNPIEIPILDFGTHGNNH